MIRNTWDEVTEMCKHLAKCYAHKRLWGVPRGGTIVAAIMSFHGCMLTRSVHAAEVIIDDVADTGLTLADYPAPTAVLFLRKGCDPQPTTFVKFIDTEEYLLMPWEDKEEVKEQIARNGFSTARGKR